jgi:hypothetical protein
MSRVPSTSCGFTSLKLPQLLVAGMVVSACSQRYLVGVGLASIWMHPACAKRGNVAAQVHQSARPHAYSQVKTVQHDMTAVSRLNPKSDIVVGVCTIQSFGEKVLR